MSNHIVIDLAVSKNSMYPTTVGQVLIAGLMIAFLGKSGQKLQRLTM